MLSAYLVRVETLIRASFHVLLQIPSQQQTLQGRVNTTINTKYRMNPKQSALKRPSHIEANTTSLYPIR